MPSLKENFEELVQRIKSGKRIHDTGFEPVYYLIFETEQILETKRYIPSWKSKLENEGYSVILFSVQELILSFLKQEPRRNLWITVDKKNPTDWQRTNDSLSNALSKSNVLPNALESCLDSLKGKSNTILFVTDLEALHPYLRIGAIESQLIGKFYVPTVFFYPGKRTGKTQLKFLNFYPEDGNYRSVHVGG